MTKKQLTFGDVTIYEHPMKLGNHPSCSVGAPVEIGWDCQDTDVQDLDMYEFFRRTERRHGRKALMIPVQERGRILLQAGYTIHEIGEAACEVEKVRKQRAESLKESPRFDGFRALMQRMGKPLATPKPVQHTVQARSA
jgi:hypothetical protein